MVQLGIHQNTLRRYSDEGRIQTIRTASGQRRYDVDAFVRESADAVVVCYCRVSSAKQREDLVRQVCFMRERYPNAEIVSDIGGGLNFRRKGLVSLLERLHRGISSELWLPIEAGLPGSDSSSSSGLPNRTAAGSWFSTTRITAPNRSSPRIFSPSSILSVADFTACAGTKTRSRRIRVYPAKAQRQTLRLWFDAARWCYNETIARLKWTGEPANWKKIKTGIIHAVPDRLKAAPYQVRSIGVRDACRAVSEVRRRNRKLKADKDHGLRLEDDWHQAKFRSRKAPRQGCFIPASAVTEFGAYYTLLGKLRMSERLPSGHGDSRLTRHNGQYHLVVTCPVQRCVSETQARVVALDPGIRSFLTWLSETDAGHIAPGAFGKIQRLCAHLDALLSRAKLERRRWAKRNKYLAADRMRVRIINLVDELHHQAARWLVDHFDIILLPTFETSEMARRAKAALQVGALDVDLRALQVQAISGLESLAVRQRRAAGQRSLAISSQFWYH